MREKRGILVALLACVCVAGMAYAADDVSALKAQLRAQDEKINALERRIGSAASVTSAVDAAVAREDASSSVITSAESGCSSRPLVIGGGLDISYQYNFNRPDNQNNNYRVFDRDSNGFNVHMAELNFTRLPTKCGEAGFRIDLAYGTDAHIASSLDNAVEPHAFNAGDSDADGITGTFPIFNNEPLATDHIVDLQQAYIEYIAPVGKGITIDAGKFVTWSGAEVIESYDNINSSRSLLFGYAIPFAHTGVRATYEVLSGCESKCGGSSGKWVVGLGVVNGWDNLQDQNDSKTLIMKSDWQPVSWFDWTITGALGNEQFDSERARLQEQINQGNYDPSSTLLDNASVPGVGALATGALWVPGDNDGGTSGLRGLIDTTLTFTPWERFTFIANGDYGTESANPWWGVAGYAKYAFDCHKNWYFAVRGEYFDDKHGVRTGIRQTMWEGTATLDWKIAEPLHMRFEYRHDHSNRSVFGDSKGVGNGGINILNPFRRQTQDTAMVSWLYKF